MIQNPLKVATKLWKNPYKRSLFNCCFLYILRKKYVKAASSQHFLTITIIKHIEDNRTINWLQPYNGNQHPLIHASQFLSYLENVVRTKDAHLCSAIATIISNLSNRKMARCTVILLTSNGIVENTYICIVSWLNTCMQYIGYNSKTTNSIPLLSIFAAFLISARSFSSSVTMES